MTIIHRDKVGEAIESKGSVTASAAVPDDEFTSAPKPKASLSVFENAPLMDGSLDDDDSGGGGLMVNLSH